MAKAATKAKVEETTEQAAAPAEQAAAPQGPRVRWDGAKMKTTYANVCNVSGTREELTLLFGTNQTWDPTQVTVQVHDRVILSPYVAKRLAALIDNVVGEYEKRFGKLEVD